MTCQQDAAGSFTLLRSCFLLLFLQPPFKSFWQPSRSSFTLLSEISLFLSFSWTRASRISKREREEEENLCYILRARLHHLFTSSPISCPVDPPRSSVRNLGFSPSATFQIPHGLLALSSFIATRSSSFGRASACMPLLYSSMPNSCVTFSPSRSFATSSPWKILSQQQQQQRLPPGDRETKGLTRIVRYLASGAVLV